MSGLLTVEQLHVTFPTYVGPVAAVRGISFEIEPGMTLGIVGESGSGKSVAAQALMGLLSRRQCRMEGEIRFNDQNLVNLPEKRYRAIRGRQIGMIFQDPMTALNPTMKVGSQVREAIERHGPYTRRQARSESIDLLGSVGIPSPDLRYHQYPHQLSGGMRQRVLIAISLACKPQLLIADEPTTALDPTLQEQVLQRIHQQQANTGMAVLLITHDIGLVANHCERMLVMYAGQIVEKGSTEKLLSTPQHPYTRGLLDSIPTLKRDQPLVPIEGSPPDLRQPPAGCAFAPRCPHAMRVCSGFRPSLDRIAISHRAACWLHDPRASGGRE